MSTFFEQTRHVKKLLVLDLGFLGDTVHLLPALWCIRKAMKKTILHVIVADHIMEIMLLAPWIDKIHGYPRFPKGPPLHKNIFYIRKLLKEKYDAVINLNGSDRSSFLTYATGATYRLGRIQEKRRWYTRFLFTTMVFEPFDQKPVYIQRWNCLKHAGFPGNHPEFVLHFPQSIDTKITRILDGSPQEFFHISPFTTTDSKELPPDILAAFLNYIHNTIPKMRFVISCAPNQREKKKLTDLLSRLSFSPWKMFTGELSLAELAALIAQSSLHIGGSSGALHLAMMKGIPTFSWAKNLREVSGWIPQGKSHTTIIGNESPSGLQDISLRKLQEKFTQYIKYSGAIPRGILLDK